MSRTRSEHIVFKIESPRDYSRGYFMYSPAAGPEGSWRCCLKVYPAGTPKSTGGYLSAFVEVIPPSHLADEWICKEVSFSIILMASKKEKSIRKTETHSFSPLHNDRGWHELVDVQQLSSPEQGIVDENYCVHLHAEVHGLPWDTSRHHFEGLDFSQPLKTFVFRLAEGPPLLFDQRLLTARSEYFQKMLDDNSGWRETELGEVDLRSDPHASQQSVAAMLQIFFDANDDLSLALSVRALADRFCIMDLLQRTEATLKYMLSEDNVLTLLSQLLDTGSEVELACWRLLQSDNSLLLRQEAVLDELVQQHPKLAKRLILMGRRRDVPDICCDYVDC
eukprot:symbB.v1.2.021795.t1/scaffold1862.1/size98264/4